MAARRSVRDGDRKVVAGRLILQVDLREDTLQAKN
jgi:hypothetical protein